MENRIESIALRERIATAEEAAAFITNGMTVAVGGYTSSGYPKAIAAELVKRKQSGEELQIRLLSGANVGPLDTLLGGAGIISWRAPMIESKVLAKQVNAGEVQYVEQQMNKMPGLLAKGAFGQIDVAIVEALRITKEGYLVPTSSVGALPQLLQQAKHIIVELNTVQPTVFDGLHDIYIPESWPNRQPIPLSSVNQRIGTPYIAIDPGKIRYIVASEIADSAAAPSESKPQTLEAADRLVAFLEYESKRFYHGALPPVQTGFGNLASEIVKGLGRSHFKELQFFCGGLQEANMRLIAEGKVKAASAGSIQMTKEVTRLLQDEADCFRKSLVLRNIDMTNSGETVHRLGIIALNSAVEMDIYGNVNSSHVAGNKVVNGLGGGANFAQNAGLSVLVLPAVNKGGAISTIVPMVSHQDISEHDIDVVVTEFGVADLRGKDDLERARAIIANCAAPDYRQMLQDYLERAIREVGGHHPQNPWEAFDWHKRLQQTGSMKL